MGLIHIELFATPDLVGQAPGGPDEDPAGFPFGGWQAPLLDEVTGAQVGAAYEGADALLLGRRTLSVRFLGPGGEGVVHCLVHDLYDGQRMRPEKLAAWQALRERYGNRDESRVEQGRLLPPTA
jgi:hypothetical protein